MKLPLCIDLDGTLIREDVTRLAVGVFVRRHPFQFWRLGIWLLSGRAYLKARLEQTVLLNIHALTYNQSLIAFIQYARKKGYTTILATAADQSIAQSIANHLGLFDEVMSSNGQINLRAQAKAKALCQRFGEAQFIYAGNSRDDLKVWAYAAKIIVVNAKSDVVRAVQRFSQPKVIIKGFREEDLKDLLGLLLGKAAPKRRAKKFKN